MVLAMFKHCLRVCKISHFLRILPPISSHSIRLFDQHYCICLERIIGRSSRTLPIISSSDISRRLESAMRHKHATAWGTCHAVQHRGHYGISVQRQNKQHLKKINLNFPKQDPDSDLEEHWGVERVFPNTFQQLHNRTTNELIPTLPHAQTCVVTCDFVLDIVAKRCRHNNLCDRATEKNSCSSHKRGCAQVEREHGFIEIANQRVRSPLSVFATMVL